MVRRRGRRPFLRRGDFYVAQDDDLRFRQKGMAAGEINRFHLPKGGAPPRQLSALFIKETNAQGFHGSHAAVAGGRAADAQDNGADSRFHGLCHHFPCAEG